MALWGREFIMFIIIYPKKIKHYKNIIKIPVYIPVFIIGLPHKRNELYIPTTVEIWSKISNIGTHGMAPNGNERTLRGCRSACRACFNGNKKGRLLSAGLYIFLVLFIVLIFRDALNLCANPMLPYLTAIQYLDTSSYSSVCVRFLQMAKHSEMDDLRILVPYQPLKLSWHEHVLRKIRFSRFCAIPVFPPIFFHVVHVFLILFLMWCIFVLTVLFMFFFVWLSLSMF